MAMLIKFNATQLEANILNIAERASKNASAELRKTAIRIRDLAREFAPRDTGTLEDAIDYMTVKDASTRRNVFIVFIDLDRMNPKGPDGAHPVGDYAWIMEEQLHPYGRQSGARRYSLGKKTSVVKAATGKKVGGRFLSRAIKLGTAEMVANATAAVRRVTGGARAIPMDYERFTGGDE